MSIDKSTAFKLWDSLRGSLLATEDNLKQIIEHRAWEPLGYATFHEAWEDRLSDIKLTGVMRATVVLEMFSQGATDTDVVVAVSGVGSKRAKAYRQAHKAKLGPKDAKAHVDKVIAVRPYSRSLPRERNAVRISGLSVTELEAWDELATGLGVDRNELLREALREGMREWGGLRAVA